jgi:hypothetical protein
MNVTTIDIPPTISQHVQSKAKDSSNHLSTNDALYPLRPEHIKDHRCWALFSCILCFFIVGPAIALYHSGRIRKMKDDDELMRAKSWSHRVSNMLIISNIIGLIVWVAILFVLGVLLLMGFFL